jgi:hypothetical protein
LLPPIRTDGPHGQTTLAAQVPVVALSWLLGNHVGQVDVQRREQPGVLAEV